jgi:N-ethylmaleimide reductase
LLTQNRLIRNLRACQPLEPDALLLSPCTLGTLELPNRIVMAPMTRNRAVGGNVPHSAAPLYYSQRASAGLIISEGSQVSPSGVGYIRTPGMHSGEQVETWKRVTDAVHAAGGRMFAQLWHSGRISHPDFLGGELPVGPSPLPPQGEITTPLGRRKFVAPRELDADELPLLIESFRWAAQNAKEAGFDGVELHGANSYLLDQFLRDGSNHRTDAYGGSCRNRARFPLDVTDAVVEVWGASRVGYRLSPNDASYGMSDSDPVTTFSYMAEALNERRIAYLHVLEPIGGSGQPLHVTRVTPSLRRKFHGALIVNGGYDAQSAEAALANGEADLVSFARAFLANPDLVERFRRGAPLNEPDYTTFFKGEEHGYTDYPSLDD